MEAHPVGMEPETLSELLSARRTTQVCEQREEASPSGLSENVVGVGDREVHRISFPRRVWCSHRMVV